MLKKTANSASITQRSSPPEVFLEKCFLKICSEFTGEHQCQSVILIKLICVFIEITLRHGYSPINLLHIFRTPFPKNTSGRLLLSILISISKKHHFQASVLVSRKTAAESKGYIYLPSQFRFYLRKPELFQIGKGLNSSNFCFIFLYEK